MKNDNTTFPFSAIIGQEDFKLALILNVIDPLLGGVLAIGDRGTGKTTLIRSLTGLMSQQVDFPFVNLPIGVSEDRMVGHVDMEQLINAKSEVITPGLMSQANGGVLYVDEVNLLQDYLTDLLLDASASGSYHLEREGLSKKFDSRFVLIGSMNPEEGALRPQLKDRFGLSVRISTVGDIKLREQIIKRRLAFDDNPDKLIKEFEEEEKALVAKIAAAQEKRSIVKVSDQCITHAASLAINHQVEGHRAEILLIRAARAFAAYKGETEVSIDDLDKVAPLVMNHRSNPSNSPIPPPNNQPNQEKKEEPNNSAANEQEKYHRALTPENEFKRPSTTPVVEEGISTLNVNNTGNNLTTDLKKSVGQYLATDKFEIKQKRKSPEKKQHQIFLLDSSGSMLKNKIIAYAKGAVQKLAEINKKQSTYFSIVSLFNGDALTVIRETSIIEEVEKALEEINTGGKTNLLVGFKHVKQLSSNDEFTHTLHVISDGKLNEGVHLEDVTLAYQSFCKGITNCHVVDAEKEIVKIGIAPEFAESIKASYEVLMAGND